MNLLPYFKMIEVTKSKTVLGAALFDRFSLLR